MGVYFVFAIIGGILGAVIAGNKKRVAGGWAILCFLLPIAVLVLLALPSLEGQLRPCPSCGREVLQGAKMCRYCGKELPAYVPPVSEQTKTCPFCAETIKAEAVFCRYCNHNL